MTSGSHAGCRFEFTGTELLIANATVQRRWTLRNGSLFPLSILHIPTRTEWIAKESSIESPCITQEPADPDANAEVTFSDQPLDAVQQHDTLIVNLKLTHSDARATTYRFQLFTDSPGITITAASTVWPATQPAELPTHYMTPSGVEVPFTATQPALRNEDILEAFPLVHPHLRFLAVSFFDRTDIRDNLVMEQEWLIHPSELRIGVQGNLFILENVLTGWGLILLKHAPAPDVRPVKCPEDAVVQAGSVRFFGHGIPTSGGVGYSYALLAYSGGSEGRTLALHRHQRQFRPYVPGRDGLLLTNTWGDRSQNKKISEAFILKEIDAAEKLGADVMQIDDGWQKGRTANTTSNAKFESWWEQPDFWLPDPRRFPNGLGPIADAIKSHNLQLGLWYAPDSINDFVNWRKDADKCLELNRTMGAHFIKIDSVKMRTRQGETNYHKFLDAVLNESNGQIVLDLDVTAGLRPGYFGAMPTGPLFVENRYTDWHKYWPHHTLRNLWMLSKYIDPLRLRMEFLNNARNADKYPDDPLAPNVYDPAYLFATVMFSSPLGWFETTGLSAQYIDSVAPLIKLWKSHRDAIFSGQTVPIGEPPSGASWTGFLNQTNDGDLYALIFRERNSRPEFRFQSTWLKNRQYAVEALFGQSSATVQDQAVNVTLGKELSFAFLKLSPR